jgi:hypothetical protein
VPEPSLPVAGIGAVDRRDGVSPADALVERILGFLLCNIVKEHGLDRVVPFGGAATRGDRRRFTGLTDVVENPPHGRRIGHKGDDTHLVTTAGTDERENLERMRVSSRIVASVGSGTEGVRVCHVYGIPVTTRSDNPKGQHVERNAPAVPSLAGGAMGQQFKRRRVAGAGVGVGYKIQDTRYKVSYCSIVTDSPNTILQRIQAPLYILC